MPREPVFRTSRQVLLAVRGPCDTEVAVEAPMRLLGQQAGGHQQEARRVKGTVPIELDRPPAQDEQGERDRKSRKEDFTFGVCPVVAGVFDGAERRGHTLRGR